MTTIDQQRRITRRTFLERGVGALGAAGVLGGVNAAGAAQDLGQKMDAAKPHSSNMTGKIAMEEHFALPETIETAQAAQSAADYWTQYGPEFRLQIQEIGSRRIAEMDRNGVELCILSLGAPGIQAIPSISQAVAISQRANDYLAERISKYPKRLKGFAALPLQDPLAAAQAHVHRG